MNIKGFALEALCTGQQNYQEETFTADRASERASD